MSGQEKQSHYYRQIAQAFLARRGAPFVLSSRDMVTISSWEEARIPLGVVLQGIERAFERSQPRLPRGRRMSSLAFCDAEVRKAFGEHKTRRVGRDSREIPRDEKRKKARREARRFLDSLPPRTECLREAYTEALAVLARSDAAEDALERLDGKVEDLILRAAGAADRGEMEKSVRADYPGRPEAAVRELSRLLLVKQWRERYRIPYLSLFYY